jgi:hypothetical protein
MSFLVVEANGKSHEKHSRLGWENTGLLILLQKFFEFLIKIEKLTDTSGLYNKNFYGRKLVCT